MDKHELISVLLEMAQSLLIDDSFEGRVSYTNFSGTEHKEIPVGKFEVNTFYRVGNSDGQGYVRSTLEIGENENTIQQSGT